MVAYHTLPANEFRENVSDFATHFLWKVVLMKLRGSEYVSHLFILSLIFNSCFAVNLRQVRDA